MHTKLLATILLPAILCWTARAQDARTVLEEVARAMGAADLRAIRFAGHGYNFALGQNYTPQDPWPRFRLESYSRMVDYETTGSQEELIRTQAESPPRGGGNQPLVGIQRQVQSVSGEYAWNMTGTLNALPERRPGIFSVPVESQQGASAAPAVAKERRLAVWLTPHGFVKAALANKPTAQSRRAGRRNVTVVSFTLNDEFQIHGTINDQNVVEKVETWISNPVLGDMLAEIVYLNYRDFGGVQFPTQILQKQGGSPTLELTVRDVEPNPRAHIETPGQVRVSAAPPPQVETQVLAEGLWFLAGGSHNSVAVEFPDFVAVIEAPQNEERSLAVLAEVRRLVSSKPIRYLINTHHHFDHSGGLRAYLAEGATLLTHEVNRRFYELTFASARKLVPDRLSQSGLRPNIETVGDNHVLRNGSRLLEIHHVQGNLHNGGLLMVYLPREKLLIEADAFTPPPPDAPPPATPSPFAVNLYENIQRLKLDVVQIAPIHGRIVPLSELLKAIGKENLPPPAGVLRAGENGGTPSRPNP